VLRKLEMFGKETLVMGDIEGAAGSEGARKGGRRDVSGGNECGSKGWNERC
jgi:hypothetical protein